MTGDKENIRNITDNWDKFVEIDFTTHVKKKNRNILSSAISTYVRW
jgi:hypothetical protein